MNTGNVILALALLFAAPAWAAIGFNKPSRQCLAAARSAGGHGEFTPSSLFKTKDVTPDEVSARIGFDDPEDLPQIVLGIGPCRSGTTAMLRVFGGAGIPAHYQQIKAGLRWAANPAEETRAYGGAIHQWKVPAGSQQPVLFLKETIGNFTPEESNLDPVAVLAASLKREFAARGKTLTDEAIDEIMKKKVHVVILGREPGASWASWQKVVKPDIPDTAAYLPNFIDSFKSVDQTARNAEAKGIPVSYYVYEMGDRAPEALGTLFRRANLNVQPVLQGWQSLPPVEDPRSNIFMPAEPDLVDPESLHERALNGPGYTYYPSAAATLPAVESQAIEQQGVNAIYRRWTERAHQQLLPKR